MMAALRLKVKKAVRSRDQWRAASLLLAVPSTSPTIILKPCVPPALGPRPSETPCSPPPLPPYCRSNENILCHRSRRNDVKVPTLQKTDHVSALPSEYPWFGWKAVHPERSNNNYSLPWLTVEAAETATDCRASPNSLNLLIKKLYSLDESQWLSSEAVVLQQVDRVEGAAEGGSSEKERPQAERQLQRPSESEKNQLPSDKATPAQMSFVLLKLREELPVFFDGHHSYHIYDAHMMFENNLSSFSWSSHNLESYRMFLESSRLALKSSFSQIELDLIKITKNVDQGKIEARWRVRGRPRYLFSLRESVLIEGFSTFLVNSSGLISLHKMDRVMPAALKEKERNQWLVWLGNLVGVATRKSPLPQPELVNSSK